MSTRAELQAAISSIRSEIADLDSRVTELEARLAALEAFEVVESVPALEPEATRATSASTVPVEGERVAAAIQTGQFFRRCLSGLPRGESGRGRVRLQNRIYVVVRSFDGTVLVFTAFSSVKALVAEGGQGNQFGDSIFAGFPSQWEARRAVSEAGLQWPASHP